MGGEEEGTGGNLTRDNHPHEGEEEGNKKKNEKRETWLMLKRISLTMSIDLNYLRREEREREREKREREERVCREGVSEQVDLKRARTSERFFLALLLGRQHLILANQGGLTGPVSLLSPLSPFTPASPSSLHLLSIFFSAVSRPPGTERAGARAGEREKLREREKDGG